MTRKLHEIAAEINQDIARKNWSLGAACHARPYIAAMAELETLADNYGQDSARSIVNYFLANAGTWRGEVARRVKKELNTMLKAAKS